VTNLAFVSNGPNKPEQFYQAFAEDLEADPVLRDAIFGRFGEFVGQQNASDDDSDDDESIDDQDEDIKINFKRYFQKFQKKIPKNAEDSVITYEGFLLKTLLNMIEGNEHPEICFAIKEQLIRQFSKKFHLLNKIETAVMLNNDQEEKIFWNFVPMLGGKQGMEVDLTELDQTIDRILSMETIETGDDPDNENQD
jgi:hypothetical protein